MTDEIRTLRCPMCGRVASVAPWCARPICVHAWDHVTPEIWDGDDADSNGRRIEESPNEEYRVPGPGTWAEMVLVESPHLATLEEMHRFLFSERYGLDQYGFPCEEGYVHEWHSGTIEDVAAALEKALGLAPGGRVPDRPKVRS